MNNRDINEGALTESDLENVTGGNAIVDGAKALGELAWEGLKWAAKKAYEVGKALEN